MHFEQKIIRVDDHKPAGAVTQVLCSNFKPLGSPTSQTFLLNLFYFFSWCCVEIIFDNFCYSVHCRGDKILQI